MLLNALFAGLGLTLRIPGAAALPAPRPQITFWDSNTKGTYENPAKNAARRVKRDVGARRYRREVKAMRREART